MRPTGKINRKSWAFASEADLSLTIDGGGGGGWRTWWWMEFLMSVESKKELRNGWNVIYCWTDNNVTMTDGCTEKDF